MKGTCEQIPFHFFLKFMMLSDAGAIYRIDGTVLINRDIFDDYLERFHEPATGNDKEKKTDER